MANIATSVLDSVLDKLGLFSEANRLARLEALGIDQSVIDAGTAARADIIAPRASSMLDDFYEHLWRQPQAREYLESDELVARLKKSQHRYLLNMGKDCFSIDYFRDRIRVGVVHHQVGLPLTLYQTANMYLQYLLYETAAKELASEPKRLSLVTRFIIGITGLDMSLAIDAYHADELVEWEERIDTMERERQSLRQEAETDPLTGAANRRHADAVLRHAEKAARQNPTSLILADIDLFKDVNDKHGHIAGDHVLKEVVKRFGHCLRKDDILARYGGDELMVILFDANIDAAKEVAERARSTVNATPVVSGDSRINTTLSIGVAQFSADQAFEHTLKRADKALYQAKETGRNKVVAAK